MTNNWKSLNPYSTGSNSNFFLAKETNAVTILILILLEVTQIKITAMIGKNCVIVLILILLEVTQMLCVAGQVIRRRHVLILILLEVTQILL